ncbi:MAG: glycosyltransferase [Culicoidibacterales bacterium]
MKRCKQPEVSVIVHLQMIGQDAEACLEALSRQTLVECQFIIIHDGKSGDALYFANEFARYDQRFEIHLQADLGCGAAYNYGLLKVIAPYVTFLNGFDVIDPNFCEQLSQQLTEQQTDIAICSATQPIWEKTTDSWIEAGSQLFNKMYRLTFLQQGQYQFKEQNRYADWLVNYQTLAGTAKISYLALILVAQSEQLVNKDAIVDHYYDIFPILEEIYQFAGKLKAEAIFALFIEAIFIETLPKFWEMNDPTKIKSQTQYCLNFLIKFYPQWRKNFEQLPTTQRLAPYYGRLIAKKLSQLGTWRWRIVWLRFITIKMMKQLRGVVN